MNETGRMQDEEQKGSEMDGEDHAGEEEEEDEEEEGEETFVNNHDLIGVQGIIAAQKTEIE